MSVDAAPATTARRPWLGPVGVVVAAGLVLAMVLLLERCGPTAPSADELTETLMVAGMNEEQARCAAEAVTENLSDADIESIMKAGPSGVPFDRVPDETKPGTDATKRVDTPEVTAARQAIAACRSFEDPVGET